MVEKPSCLSDRRGRVSAQCRRKRTLLDELSSGHKNHIQLRLLSTERETMCLLFGLPCIAFSMARETWLGLPAKVPTLSMHYPEQESEAKGGSTELTTNRKCQAGRFSFNVSRLCRSIH